MEFNKIDVQIGKTVDFVELQNHFIVKRALAFACGRDYVKPCFSKRGITLSIEEAQAVAFGAMQLENGKHSSTGDDEYAYKAKGVVYEEWELPGVYENKKFMQAYVDLQKEVQAIYEAYLAVDDFYFQNKNSPRIDAKTLETLKEKNIKLTIKYIGCSSDTPSEKIPTDTETKVITYPDIVGDWVVDEPGDDDELLHGDYNGGNSDNDSNDDETGYEITPVDAFYIFSPSYYDPSSGYTTLYIWTNKSTGEKILSSSDYKINRRGNIRNNTYTNFLGFYVGGYRYTALYVRSVGEIFYYYFD